MYNDIYKYLHLKAFICPSDESKYISKIYKQHIIYFTKGNQETTRVVWKQVERLECELRFSYFLEYHLKFQSRQLFGIYSNFYFRIKKSKKMIIRMIPKYIAGHKYCYFFIKNKN